MRLWLIRHGEKGQYIGDVDKIKLTEKGCKQADLLVKRLKNENIEIIYSSTMYRAKQTTTLTKQELSVKLYSKNKIGYRK